MFSYQLRVSYFHNGIAPTHFPLHTDTMQTKQTVGDLSTKYSYIMRIEGRRTNLLLIATRIFGQCSSTAYFGGGKGGGTLINCPNQTTVFGACIEHNAAM